LASVGAGPVQGGGAGAEGEEQFGLGAVAGVGGDVARAVLAAGFVEVVAAGVELDGQGCPGPGGAVELIEVLVQGDQVVS
jgi:hypothetical protein